MYEYIETRIKIPFGHRRKAFSSPQKAEKNPEKAKKDIYNANLAGNKAEKNPDKAQKGIYKASKHPRNVILTLFNAILAFRGCILVFHRTKKIFGTGVLKSNRSYLRLREKNLNNPPVFHLRAWKS
jgi:hypothetical protein